MNRRAASADFCCQGSCGETGGLSSAKSGSSIPSRKAAMAFLGYAAPLLVKVHFRTKHEFQDSR
jgi:hypothetical protein